MESHDKKAETRFRRIGIITIIAVYLLILVGGIVRSTGSGMGCPDWPKCFGSWVPPSDVSELPADYKAIYSAKRHAKNVKLSGYLEFFGFAKLANNIRNDEAILAETAFNPIKTRIEYLNRLLGATTGILIIITSICSLVYVNKANRIPILAFSSLVLVVFQGWIGSIVVSTNLLPWMITIHMLLAFLLLGLLIYMLYEAIPEYKMPETGQKLSLVKNLLLLCLFTLLIQVVVGTQVREAIDEIAISYEFSNRAAWIGELDFGFYFHRSFSILVLGLHVWLVVLLLRKFDKQTKVVRLTNLLMLFVGLEIISGIIMAYFAIPSYMQPVHLLLSSLIFGLQFLLLLMMSDKKSEREQNILSANTLLDSVHKKQIAFKG